MNINTINEYLKYKQLWQAISLITLSAYLFPFIYYQDTLPVLIFDNLDSNIVWLKLLAESKMIFSSNNVIVPNMMNGLPRISYGSEFNILVWLYYFFSPITAYIINIFLIHIIAFISMFYLSSHYLVPKNISEKYIIIYFSSLIFALQPFWPSAGLSISFLPLVSYIFLNIYHSKSTTFQWILLIIIPLYTSFILVYLFYLSFIIFYFLVKMNRDNTFKPYVLLAILLMTTSYILVEYRLFLSIFVNNTFISHRTEFNIYFTKELPEVLKIFSAFFLEGHHTHLHNLYMPLLLPLMLISILFELRQKKFSILESSIIFLIFILTIYLNIWSYIFSNIYALPVLFLSLIILSLIYRPKVFLIKYFILLMFLAAIYSFTFYKGFDFITQILPIFKSFSLARASFIQPLVLVIVLILALKIILKKHRLGIIFISLLLPFQLYYSFKNSFYSLHDTREHVSFKNYYAVTLFQQVKQYLDKDTDTLRVLSYGIEPAVSLYNGFYTIDGYSVNYPLTYKHQFASLNMQDNIKTNTQTTNIYKDWGSKVYILGMGSSPKQYIKGLKVNFLHVNTHALCQLGTNYIISSYQLLNTNEKELSYLQQFSGDEYSWDIFLYKVNCI